jgi:thioredoxin 1
MHTADGSVRPYDAGALWLYMLELTTDTFSETTSAGTSVIDFWADWCGPCKALAPAFASAAQSMTGDVTFAKLDVDSNPEIAKQYNVMSIPTILILKDGVELGRLIGARSTDQLINEVSTLIS